MQRTTLSAFFMLLTVSKAGSLAPSHEAVLSQQISPRLTQNPCKIWLFAYTNPVMLLLGHSALPAGHVWHVALLPGVLLKQVQSQRYLAPAQLLRRCTFIPSNCTDFLLLGPLQFGSSRAGAVLQGHSRGIWRPRP